MKPNRFTERSRPSRIAAYVSHGFPVAEHEGLYAELDAVGGALDAEIRVFHGGVPDPGPLSPALRARVGSGFYVPPHRAIHDNDIAYFRTTRPERAESILRALAEIADSTIEEVLELPLVRAAFSHARWLMGWGADYVHSWFVYDQSAIALIASQLVGVPRGITLHGLGDGHGHTALVPLHIANAALIVVPTVELRSCIESRFGSGAARRTVLQSDFEAGEPAPIRTIRRLLSGAEAQGGPDAAFLRDPGAKRAPRAKPRPLLVLGAERTGSNMLTGMLSSRPDIHCAGELFNPNFIRDGTVPWHGGHPEPLAELAELRKRDPGACVERLFTEGRARGDVATGFKLLYYHGAADDRIVDWLWAEPELCVLHLRRRMRLLRWVSHSRAEESGSWYLDRRSRGGGPPPPLELDVAKALADFAYVELMEERFAAVFREHAGLDLDYEDAAADVEWTSARLGEVLGLELGKLAVRSRKQGGSDLAASVANLQELRDAVRGTRWAELFEDD